MSKKPRPKKKYRPHAVAVPHYLNSLTSDVNRRHDARDEDRVFLLQVANRTLKRLISPCTVRSCRSHGF